MRDRGQTVNRSRNLFFYHITFYELCSRYLSKWFTWNLEYSYPSGKSDLEFVGKYHEKFAGLRWVIEFKYYANAELRKSPSFSCLRCNLTRQSNNGTLSVTMDTLQLQQEQAIVQKVEQSLKECGPFVSLAEAARQAGVPLPTLSEAVRTGRVPALRVQPRRWLVRIAAVRSYFNYSTQNPHQVLQQRLIEAGLLHTTKLDQHFSEFEPIPVKGKPTSEILLEERR